MIDFRRTLFGKRLQKDERVARPGLELELRQNLKPSRLMADVLQPQDGPPADIGDRGRELDRSRSLGIGQSLHDGVLLLFQASERLSHVVDRESGDFLRDSIAQSVAAPCRIAVVGQMNAGKSSLINALVEEGDLLPSEVNPWTTVLTRLHFGVPGLPSSGASFQMFTRDEWRRLAAGGRTRELVTGLIEDFDWDRLQAQVDETMARAHEKLGGRLETLLGSEHTYAVITNGLLARYVAAGEFKSGSATSDAGEFADVTKIANVYLGLGAFTYPAIVIDTPGVNDPFLVRDEITRQSLEETDICIVVVTARDPLSESDLNLLRLLHRLGRSRVVIFVNKLDEIEPVPNIEELLRSRIEGKLDSELKRMGIPIVFGSVIWGRQALAAQAHIAASNAAPVDLAYGDPSDAAMTPGALLDRSGLPDLTVAISKFMQSGPIADRLFDETNTIEAFAANALNACEFEISLLSEGHGNVDFVDGKIQAFEDKWHLPELLSDMEARFFSLIAEWLPILERDLHAVVRQIMGGVHRETTPEWLEWWRRAELQTRLALETKAASSVLAAVGTLHAEERNTMNNVSGNQNVHIPWTEKAARGQLHAYHLANPIAQTAADTDGVNDQEQGQTLSSAAFIPVVRAMVQQAASDLMDYSNSRIERLKLVTVRPFEVALEYVRGIDEERMGETGLRQALADREAKANELRDILLMITRFKQSNPHS